MNKEWMKGSLHNADPWTVSDFRLDLKSNQATTQHKMLIKHRDCVSIISFLVSWSWVKEAFVSGHCIEQLTAIDRRRLKGVAVRARMPSCGWPPVTHLSGDHIFILVVLCCTEGRRYASRQRFLLFHPFTHYFCLSGSDSSRSISHRHVHHRLVLSPLSELCGQQTRQSTHSVQTL